MITMLKIKAIEKMVHQWTNENGQGDYIHSVDMNLQGVTNETTTKAVSDAINDMLYLHDQKTTPEDIEDGIEFMIDTEQDFFIVSTIEDSNGYEDVKGSYISDYFIVIEKVQSLNGNDIKQLLKYKIEKE